ncbi:L-rhamnono-gamma-lactonase [Apiospora saccharicola]|uniref:L-rhamnono-gamma-lactonase n=1 Tax=Apiospora saccharicola TaxID=335842 RepID=A0ABR1WHE9_9PEZI
MAENFPIIDSHIHLYPESEIPTLSWATPENPLAKQHSVEDYKEATATSPAPVKGFIFLETDRKHDLEAGAKDGSGWEYPLMEVSWLKRIALGQPKAGEGHAAEDAGLCSAYIPWAPIPSGAAAMEKYLAKAEGAAGDSWSKVRGFRYLLQDKPDGTALGDGFIESLKLLGRKGYVFDVGVNQHDRGRIQLEETVEMIDKAHDGVPDEEKVVFILNHLCKPDLTVINIHTDTSFIAWRTAMFTLSKCSSTYMKLSGAFPEMDDSLKNRPVEDIFEAIMPWLSVVLAAFGPSRIMFGSDWPVCTVGVDGAWEKWRQIVDRLCYMASLGDEDKEMIWSGTALKAYGIQTEQRSQFEFVY